MSKTLYCNDGISLVEFYDGNYIEIFDDTNSYRARIYDLLKYIDALDTVIYDGHLDIPNVCTGNNILASRREDIKKACKEVADMILDMPNFTRDNLMKKQLLMLRSIKERLESRRKGNENETSSSENASVS